MNVAHDLFAETNPAFGAFALLAFSRSYLRARKDGPSLALAYVALPIALSNDLDRSFTETAATTGMLAWLNRYPEVKIQLGSRLDACRDVVTAALRYGLSAKALTLLPDGTLQPGASAPSEKPLEGLPEEPMDVMRRAKRLGTWMGKSGAAGTVFSAFGVTP